MNHYKYVIYLDIKIKGALYQVIHYFKQGVFNEDTLLVYRQYSEIDKLFKKELKRNNINFQLFRRYKDMPCINEKIVFYLFNAQSNCRIVSNRNAKHIFVTHGESNKASSIKPIIRIYDYIVTAGNLGIDRFLCNKVFYEEDVRRNRILKMGDTFVGVPKYSYSKHSKAILYAPTWEGGVVEENYSSLNKDLKAFIILNEVIKSNDILKLYVQLHPNTGHRDVKYVKNFINGVKFIAKQSPNIVIAIDSYQLSFACKVLVSLKKNIEILTKGDPTIKSICHAFTDISAMEVQLLSKNIPVSVFNMGIGEDNFNNCVFNNRKKSYVTNIESTPSNLEVIDTEYQKYSMSYQTTDLKNTPLNKRIDWLVNYISTSGLDKTKL